MQIELIDDDERAYGRTMRDVVLPALAKCRAEGWMEPAQSPGLAKLKPVPLDDAESRAGDVAAHPGSGSVKAGPGALGKLHYVCYSAQKFDDLSISGASAEFRGAIVISHGFTEFAEKYAEMAWYFLLAGYSVCILEHRGHGYSPRDVSNPSLVWIDNWHRYVEDLAEFARTVGREYAGDQPYSLYAHSMGGAIGAAVLEQYPDLFDRAVLNAPGMSPTTGFPNWLALPVTGAASRVGLSKSRAPGQKDFAPDMPDKGHDASAPARAHWYRDLRVHDVHYQTNAATFGYVYEFLKMGRAVQGSEACAAIQTPILLFQAGRDVWVHEDGQFRFVERVTDGGGQIELERIDGAVHEIFSMPNDVLGPYLKEITDFLAMES